jgi:TetR/AcrR family transcriptional regulator, transcriptional repressor for nem operon
MDQSSISTSELILDVAQKLVQTRGYNAFSYADIAAALKVTKASLHYHFPSKSHLGHSLVTRYAARFRSLLEGIDAKESTAAEKLRCYVAIYAGVLADHRMCLCGMLAAEFETLPKLMQSALDHFFDMNERWIMEVLKLGSADGSLKIIGDFREQAEFFVAALEGAMMLARSHASDERFRVAAIRLLAQFGA